jgi:hypothetical protein
MSREVRRVPLGFDWPLNKVWTGFVSPDWLDEMSCTACDGGGYSPRAKVLWDQWYGNAPFRPEDNGSTPWLPMDEPIRRFAEHNVANSPEFYGTGEAAIDREARRLLSHWNGMWAHHLSEQDIEDLLAADQLTEFTHRRVDGNLLPIKPRPSITAREVNAASFFDIFSGTSRAWRLIQARAEREGFSDECAVCHGHGSIERFVGQRQVQEAWQKVNPPTGEAWQLWETVSEGSPVTPAFATAEELAAHIATPSLSTADALAWITGPGWAPSMIIGTSGLLSNVEAGVALMAGSGTPATGSVSHE